MADDIVNAGDIDPEIANLLGDDSSPSSVPDFSDLFDEGRKEASKEEARAKTPEDISKEAFPSITAWEQEPDPLFTDKHFYRDVLNGEGDISHRVHSLLQKFLKCEDPQERGVYRQRLMPAWWDLARQLTASYQKGPKAKRWALRFGYLLPTLVSARQRAMLAKVVQANALDEPVHYVDEWLTLVGSGTVNPLASDEVKLSRQSAEIKAKNRIEKAQGDKDANLTLLKNLYVARDGAEAELLAKAQSVQSHENHPTHDGLRYPYSPDKKASLSRINELIRKISKLDKDIAHNSLRLKEADVTLSKLDDKLDMFQDEAPVADVGAVEKEMDNLRQMAKLCVGRQGNHFPFLMKNFFFQNLDLIGTRENVVRAMDQVEQIDPGVFRRTFRQKTNRIVPHVVLIPCYGDRGICWEPFERFNRSTSRGRVGIPMYPKNLKLAVIYALGDLRWNVAKEKAQHYWMEEGLTGHYYQWFNSRKMRGDVRLKFLEDYVLWITKEPEAVQKLDKEVRAIFWRNMPFPQTLKDTLRNRGFVYNELYKKDLNRSMSDGY